MNTIEPDLEQQLRTHYQQEMGDPPSSSALWHDIADRLPEQEQPTTRWQRLLQVFSPAGSPVYYMPRPAPARRFVVAGSLVCILLLLFGIVYAAGSFWPGHSLIGGKPFASSDDADALFAQLLHSNKTPQSIQHMAQTGQLTNVHITKKVGSYTVTLQKLYVDANNIVIGYTIDGNMQAIGIGSNLVTVTLNEQMILGVAPDWHFIRADKEATRITFNSKSMAALSYLDASSFLGNPQQVNVHIAMSIGAVQDATTFDQTVPFHAGKTVKVNQAVMSNGHALTLDHVMITPSEARAYFTYQDKTLFPDGLSPADQGSLSVAGRTFNSELFPDESSPAARSGFTSVSISDTLDFWDNLQNDTGTWILKVSRSKFEVPVKTTDDTWQFTFTVS
jgi:hypothetical protein